MLKSEMAALIPKPFCQSQAKRWITSVDRIFKSLTMHAVSATLPPSPERSETPTEPTCSTPLAPSARSVKPLSRLSFMLEVLLACQSAAYPLWYLYVACVRLLHGLDSSVTRIENNCNTEIQLLEQTELGRLDILHVNG